MNRSAGLRHGLFPVPIPHRAVPEAGAPVRRGSSSQCTASNSWGLLLNRSAELQLGAVWRAPNAPTWRSALQARVSASPRLAP